MGKLILVLGGAVAYMGLLFLVAKVCGLNRAKKKQQEEALRQNQTKS